MPDVATFMPHSRREFLRLTLAALAGATAASLGAACGPGSQPSGGAAPAGAPTTAPAAAGAPAAASIAEPTATPFAVAAFGSNSAKVAIRYWTILGSVDGIVMNDLVRKFSEANTDIRIESLQGVTDFITKMETAAISGTAPDVALVRHTYIGPFADKKVLTPLTQAELDQVGIAANNFDPTVWKFSQYQGQQYTIPLDIHCHAMLYNKALFAGGGVQPPTTLDEWSNAVAKLTSGDVIGYNTFGIGGGASEVLCWYWYGIQQQFGGEMLTPDASKAAFNSPEGIAAVNWMRDVQQKGNSKAVPTADLIRTGKVASTADGPWISTLLFDKTKAAAADDLEVLPLPQHDLNKKATWAQSHQFALPKQRSQDAAKREASLRFVKWMGEHSVDWAKAGQVPAHNAARQEVLGSDDPQFKRLQVWASELPYAAFMPTSPHLLEVMPRIAANVEGALLNQWTVEEGLKKAETEVNQILSRA